MSGALFLSPAQVAEQLGIPVSTLTYWAWAGTAPEGFPVPVRIGSRLRYPKAALDSWIESQVATAEAGARGG